MARPVKGDIVDGYRLVGDDINDPASWEFVGPQPLPQGSSREAIASAAEEERGNPIAIGLGRLLDTSAAGLKQAALETANKISPSEKLRQELANLYEEQSANTQAYKRYQQRFPLDTAIGEAAPYAFMPGGPLGVGLKMGAMEGMRYGNPQERATNALVGLGSGFASGLIGNAVSGYVNPKLSTMQRNALREGSEMGIQPRLSEVTQSPAVARYEDMAARIPGGAGVFEDFNKANTKAVNRAAAASMGQPADASGQVSDEVFASAKRDLGKVFDAIKSVGKVNIGGRLVNPIQLDSGVISAADDVIRTQAKLGNRANQQIVDLAKQAKRMAGLRSRIDGEAYQLWHSDLTDASFSAYKANDSTSGKAYKGLLTALDHAAESSLRRANLGGLADELKAVRPLYANYKLLLRGTVAEGGDVSPARVAQALRTLNPTAFRTGGGGELSKLGRYAEAFPPLRAGSQTFERGVTADPIAAAALGGPAYGIAKATTSPAVTYIPRKLGGTTAGAIAGPAASYSTRAGILSFLKRLMQAQTPQ